MICIEEARANGEKRSDFFFLFRKAGSEKKIYIDFYKRFLWIPTGGREIEIII